MATIASSPKSALERERSFFFKMAIAMATVIVAGFSFNLASGRSTFGVPLLYHVHAFVFFGWVVLYVTQNALVATGNVRLHSSLGVLALAWMPAMVGLGIALTIRSLQATGGPFFFDMNEFLFGNSLGMIAFACIVTWALIVRQRSDWHRRLMCCAMACMTGPGFGRLLPMPFFIPWGWWIASVVVPSIFILIGMIADKRRSGRVHPAWLWGFAFLAGSQLLADVVAYSDLGISITRDVVAGTPGAERDMKAYLPPDFLAP